MTRWQEQREVLAVMKEGPAVEERMATEIPA